MIRLVLAEDNALLRDGIALLLSDHGIDVAAAVADADTLLSAVDEHNPDVAVIDVRMPPTFTDEGIRAALELRARRPQLGLLVFSQWVELTYARQLLAGNASRVGYLLKDRILSSADFVEAIRRIAAGGTALDPDVVHQLFAQPAVDKRLQRLTPRERSIIARLAEGRSNQAIANIEHLALRSVEKVIATIFEKLDLPSNSTDHRRVLAVLTYLHHQPD